MSATPIPRTLQMSLAGLRDISVIETPPEGRRPVKTYVGEYDEQLVQAGDRARARARRPGVLPAQPRRDDRRDGRAAARAVPGLRFVVAHGQLDEQRAGGADARVPARRRRRARGTSIIESGIDIPQANTLIVERADHFGLAQLYQIRGRVGPQSRSAPTRTSCIRRAAALTPEAAQRLSRAVGLHRARRRLQGRDARPRAARRRQPARRRAVGPRRRARLRAVHADARRGGGGAGRARTARRGRREPVRLDVNVDAYVPADYVPYEQAKIDVHRRIAGAREVAELDELRDELEDRFGPLPEPLENLLALQHARIKLGQAGARAVSFRSGRLAVTPIELDRARAKRFARRSRRRSTSPASRSCRCGCPTTRRRASRPSCGPPTPPARGNARGRLRRRPQAVRLRAPEGETSHPQAVRLRVPEGETSHPQAVRLRAPEGETPASGLVIGYVSTAVR